MVRLFSGIVMMLVFGFFYLHSAAAALTVELLQDMDVFSDTSYGIYAQSTAPSETTILGTSYYAGLYAEGIDRGVWGRSTNTGGFGAYAEGANGIYAYTFDPAGYGVTSFSYLTTPFFGSPIEGGQLFLGRICTQSTFLGCSTQANVFRVDRAGKVFANGNFQASGADVAEHIQVMKAPGLGDVVEIDPDHEGFFRPVQTPNSTLVAGVISTNPGLTMNAADPAGDRPEQGPRLALTGRVPVKSTTENGPIRPGDLLVSSSTVGHAMRAPSGPASGTVIGKALGSLKQGTGIVEMLIMLR